MTNREAYENFIKAFKDLKGKHIWIIEEVPVERRVVEPGGCDHLGPLPDRVHTVIDHYEKKIRMLTIDEFNIRRLLLGTKPYFSKEVAEYILLLEGKNE